MSDEQSLLSIGSCAFPWWIVGVANRKMLKLPTAKYKLDNCFCQSPNQKSHVNEI
jgi:hypothetical protein